MIVCTSQQGSESWLQERRGVTTGSRAKCCRERLKKSGDLSAAATLYAQDLARERCGGTAQSVYVNQAMRFGTEQEPIARSYYEAETGLIVEAAGFICTDDRKFGSSVDGLVQPAGMVEIKTLVSSDTVFRVLVDGDISEYVDQCNFSIWLLGLKWCDLILWAPDLPKKMTVIRIERNDDAINELEADLIKFERVVSEYEAKLRAAMAEPLAMAA